MAIYHLRASVISRSQGRSATAAIAYRAAERIEDRRTGLTFDYAAKRGVDHTEILAPDYAPDWVFDRSELWNRVEEAETRVNSQVAREIRVALPNELGPVIRAELVREFCQEQFVERGMVADIALHAPSGAGDERNHHAHILLTTRRIGPDGFTSKDRDWNKTEVLEAWRSSWSRDTNAALERAGLDERVDHRTLEAQRGEALERVLEARERGDEGAELEQTVRAISLDRPPLPQLSPGAWQMKERGHEVGAVRAWHEAKTYALEVSRAVQELGEQMRDWLDRQADRILDRMAPERRAAIASGPDMDREPPQDLAARLREAWEGRQSGQGVQEATKSDREPEPDAPGRDRGSSKDLADRLRRAGEGIDRSVLAERAKALRESREAEERARKQEADRVRAEEVRRERELQDQRERKDHERDSRGWDR